MTFGVNTVVEPVKQKIESNDTKKNINSIVKLDEVSMNEMNHSKTTKTIHNKELEKEETRVEKYTENEKSKLNKHSLEKFYHEVNTKFPNLKPDIRLM